MCLSWYILKSIFDKSYAYRGFWYGLPGNFVVIIKMSYEISDFNHMD